MEYMLITGANRGIGLELVRQYLTESENFIFAACRNPDGAIDLNELVIECPERLVMLEMDVSKPEAIQNAVIMIQAYTEKLDILINNAGINPSGQSLNAITMDTMMQVLQVNTAAPLMVVQAFLELLKHGEHTRVINMSSQLGSIARRNSSGNYGYCASKAALNMITRCMASDLAPYGIVTVTMHPGWVQTDMGGNHAPLSPEESVEGMRNIIQQLDSEHNGQFYQWNGESLPW